MNSLANVKPANEHPPIKNKLEKIVEVQLEKEAIEKEIRGHLARMSTPRSKSLDDKARTFLESGNFAETAIPLDTKLEELYERRRTINRALELARNDLDLERDKYSREVSLRVEHHYRERVQAIAYAAELTVQAAAAERDFRSELEEKGIGIYLPPAAFPYLGFALDHPDKGFAARWLSEVRKAGLVR
jgi:hypothetical protein